MSTLLISLVLIWFSLNDVRGSNLFTLSDGPSNTNSSRILESEINPGCNSTTCSCDCDSSRMVHTISSSPEDVDHYIWSQVLDGSGGDSPGFLMYESSMDDELHVNWKSYLSDNSSGSIIVSDVKNAMGIQINNVFFFNDLQSRGDLNFSANDTKVWWLSELTNVTLHPLQSSNDSSQATFSYQDDNSNFTVNFYLYTKGYNGRNQYLPGLLYTPRSFHLEILVNGSSNVTYTKNRMGLDISLYHPKGKFLPEQSETIDDEFSPGVFRKYTAHFRNENSNKSSYLEWKPVGYSKSDRIIAHTVDARILDSIHFAESDLPVENRAIKGFFGQLDGYGVSRFNITFGSQKDGFYSNTNYTSFALLIGFNDPPQESLSFMVKMVILVGFGIPVVAIFISGVYLTVKRCRRSSSSSGYNDLTDD